MLKLEELVNSLEAIDFQEGFNLFKELTLKINAFRKGKLNQAELNKLKIPNLIKKYTNIFVNISFQEGGENAYIVPPFFVNNNTLLADDFRVWYSGYDEMELLKQYTNKTEGRIDLKEGKVHGFFEDLEFDMYLLSDLFEGNKFTSSEIAAIVLHELGHAFTFMEFFGRTYKTNMALNTMLNRLDKEDKRVKRIKIMENMAEELDLPPKMAEAVVDSNNETIRLVYLTTAFTPKHNSSINTKVYDNTSFEYISDQFAARHGAGRDLTTALDKIFKVPDTLESKVLHHTTMLFKIFFRLTGLTILTTPIYDEPLERFERIKEQLVAALKDKHLDNGMRKQFLEDLKLFDEIIKQYKSKDGIYARILDLVSIIQRADFSQRKLQRELEKLGSNDLFVVAAKLNSTIKEG